MQKLSLILILLVIVSCSQSEEETPSTEVHGNYTGTFIRTHPQVKFAPSNVVLKLTGGQFEGESDRENYPAICHGDYTVGNDQILFEESCVWTADFDWSYILSGSFDYSMSGDELTLARQDGDFIDYYILARQ